MVLRRRPLLFAIAVSTFGCAAVLGIPSDVERESPAPADGGDAAVDTGTGADVAPPPDVDRPDAVDAADAADAGPPLCDPTKDFDPPTPLDSLNTPEDDGAARLSEDELTIYVDGVRAAEGPSFNIWFATRPALTDSFGPLQPFPSIDGSIDTTDDEYAPNVTADGLALVFERKNLATQNSDFYTATRAKTTDPFGPVSSIANLNTLDYEGNPFIRGDVKELWHVRKPTSNNVDIALATLVPGSGYVISTVIGGPAYDASPVISKDKLTLYFTSDRSGAGHAGTNIWVATRTTPTGAFGAPTPVANVSSDSNEYPGWISGDGCRLYLVSSRPGGKGKQDVYVASRPR
jgi:hypothetical protein